MEVLWLRSSDGKWRRMKIYGLSLLAIMFARITRRALFLTLTFTTAVTVFLLVPSVRVNLIIYSPRSSEIL
jgi:hypothetical protein